MLRNKLLVAAAVVVAGATGANARIVISHGPTENMSCATGVCTPTSSNAVLNVGDLEALLATGNLEIDTHAKHVNAKTIDFEVPVQWSSPSMLVLTDSNTLVNQRVSVTGSGGVNIFTFERLIFGPKGKITFTGSSGTLIINGSTYQLVSTLPALAGAIAANPQGDFALANSYNASQDGVYSVSPISTNFDGYLVGLGNTISNISINNANECCVGGLFESISARGAVAGIRLKNLSVLSNHGAAGLVYENFGILFSNSVTGSVAGGSDASAVAGLVAIDYGQVNASYSSASVTSSSGNSDAGGLVGAEFGMTQNSFATGAVSVSGAGNIGGLIGEVAENGMAADCYATGNISGGPGSNVGGIVGQNDFNSNQVSTSYAIGVVSGGSGSAVGGAFGVNDSKRVVYEYWDTTTSGTSIGVGLGNGSEITGLTSEQLEANLPYGFDTKTWAENPKINNGFPYLTSNPPPK